MAIQNAYKQSAEHMPTGGGDIFIKQLTDKYGNDLAVPVLRHFTAMEFQPSVTGKEEVFRGSSKFATAAASGEGEAKLTFKIPNIDPHTANMLFFGDDSVQGGVIPLEQQFILPDYNPVNVKIANVKTYHLGKLSSFTSLTIAGAAGTRVYQNPTSTKQFKLDGEKFTFAKTDIGKSCAITWVGIGGATVVSTFKITKNTYLLSAFDGNSTVTVKKGAATWTRDTYNPASGAPATTHYQCSQSGVMVHYSSDTGSITVTHRTDGVSVSSVIATLPAAAYRFITDPPGAINWVSTDSVVLVSDAGSAMTGVTVGGELTNAATPTSGQYDDSTGGIYLFAAADVGDVVQIRYLGDYYAFVFAPPEGGRFEELLALQNGQRQPLTQVALTSPLSIGYNEYCVNAAGVVYVSGANAGETWTAWANCYDPAASGFAAENSAQGHGVELEITATVAGNGKRYAYKGVHGKCNGYKPGATKAGGFADPSQFEVIMTTYQIIDNDGNLRDVLFEYSYTDALP